MRNKISLSAITLLIGFSIFMGGASDLREAVAGSPGNSWDGYLKGNHQKTTPLDMERKLRSEGIQNTGPIMSAPYLVKIEIKDTGGGSASHSEVLIQFKNAPKGAVGKAWADRNEKNRAEIGNLNSCPTAGYTPEGHRCPTSYNAVGWVDLTKAVNKNNQVLIINDPDAGFRAGTVVWFAFDLPQNNISYDIIEKRSDPSFGFGRISAEKYNMKKETPPPPVPGAAWDGYLEGQHKQVTRREMGNMLRSAGITNSNALLGHNYIVGIDIKDTGGGSASHSEVLLQFTSTPKAAIGKAWADQNERNRAEIGNLSSCPVAGYTPEGHQCPTKYNAVGWVDLTLAVNRNNKVLIINDPNVGYRGGTTVWLAFDNAQNRIPFDIIEKKTGKTFGFGKISARKFLIRKDAPPPPPPPPPPDKAVDGNLRGPHKKISRADFAARLRADGIQDVDRFLTRGHYVRVEITNTGGGSASHSEVVIEFATKPKFAMGKAWADQNQPNRAQIGNLARCRTGGTYPPEGHSCTRNYNGQGWVNLTKAVNRGKKVIIINDPNIGNRANTIIWFRFDKKQNNIPYNIIEKRTGKTFGFGKISAQKFVTVAGPPIHKPSHQPGPGGPGDYRRNRPQ